MRRSCSGWRNSRLRSLLITPRLVANDEADVARAHAVVRRKLSRADSSGGVPRANFGNLGSHQLCHAVTFPARAAFRVGMHAAPLTAGAAFRMEVRSVPLTARNALGVRVRP